MDLDAIGSCWNAHYQERMMMWRDREGDRDSPPLKPVLLLPPPYHHELKNRCIFKTTKNRLTN
jgi:hypothetical protein